MSVTNGSTGQARTSTLVLDATSEASYQARFTTMFAQLRTDPAALEAFTANPRPKLESAGIPVGATPPSAGLAGSYSCTVDTYWWGLNITMNESLTQAIVTGTIAAGPLATLVSSALVAAGVVTGPVGAVIGSAFASAFALKVVEIKLIDDGNGVYWPVSWPQLAAVLAAVPTGPAGIIAAIMIFIHPVAN